MASCFEPFRIFATKKILSRDLFILPYICNLLQRYGYHTVRYLQLKSLKTDQVMNVNTVRILVQTGTVRFTRMEICCRYK